MRKDSFYKLFLFLALALASLHVNAQTVPDIFKGRDLTQVKVDQMSDDDIDKLKAQIASAGIPMDQVEKMAISKGLPPAEFAKLKLRLEQRTDNTNNLPNNGKLRTTARASAERGNNSSDSLDTEKYNDGIPKPLINPLIFGSELYTSVSPTFEPNLKLATPVNYVLGPDDQILISVYGIQEYNGDLLVSAEGTISIPNVGILKVAGLTIEAATQKIKTFMANSRYPYLKNGGSKISVTLSKIRSIKVTVIGSNRPGQLTVSSLTTVFNVLFLAGGPNSFGSFREIELLRNSKVIQKIDLYRFLLHGDQSENISLNDNDVIRIPPYKKRVQLEGQIKRPGIFEVLPGETFSDIKEFASGFTDTAYQASVKVYQRNDRERTVRDLAAAEYNTYMPQSGDLFTVSKILNRFLNRVTISGAVYRPDIYELSPGLTVAALIKRADGLMTNAYTGRGQVIRLEDDLTRSILSFDVQKALAGDNSNNPVLRREDQVFISSLQDLRDSFKVTIQGEVRQPGSYDYVSNLTLKDLILQANGFTDAAYKSIEIARLIKRDSIVPSDNRASTIISAEVNGELSLSPAANIPLQPFDVITIRRKAGYTLPESVLVSGEVQYPGPYALSSSNERVSDVLKRAGGYTPIAYPQGAYLKRYKTEKEKEKSEDVAKKLQRSIKDTSTAVSVAKEITRGYDQIPLDMIAIIENPGSIADITLKAKDELFIPKFDAQVTVSGAVLLVTQVPYRPNNTLNDYIDEAGGYNGDAWKKKAYVVYANGSAATTKHFLFFKFYPKILPGSELIVPKKPERKGASTGEIIALSSGLASLAGLIIAILKL